MLSLVFCGMWSFRRWVAQFWASYATAFCSFLHLLYTYLLLQSPFSASYLYRRCEKHWKYKLIKHLEDPILFVLTVLVHVEHFCILWYGIRIETYETGATRPKDVEGMKLWLTGFFYVWSMEMYGDPWLILHNSAEDTKHGCLCVAFFASLIGPKKHACNHHACVQLIFVRACYEVFFRLYYT